MSQKDIPVVILAGGKGMRMQDYNANLPKALVKVGPYPVILHIMDTYSFYGHKKFILALGYKGELIREFFNKKEWHNIHNEKLRNLGDIEVKFVDTGLDTQTGGRVKKVEKDIETDNFFLTYCDGLTDADLKSELDFHTKLGKIGTMLLVHPMSPFGIVDVDAEGLVSSFKEKPFMPSYINGGYFIFTKRIFDYLDEGCILEETPLSNLSKDRQLAGYKHEGFWTCMDTYKDVVRVNNLWSTGVMMHTGYKGQVPWIKS